MGETIHGILSLSLLAGLATVIGVFIVFYFGIPNRQVMAGYLGLAAGVMTTVSIDLVFHSFQVGGSKTLVYGLLMGTLSMTIIARVIAIIQQQYARKRRIMNVAFARIGWTMVFGIAAHNLPEGLAIAAGDATNHKLGLTILIAIALHNIPEGIGVTAPLLKSGTKKTTILVVLILVALCVPLGTVLGQYFIDTSTEFISMALSFAAGAMLYIVLFELIPSAWKQQPVYAQVGILVGVITLYLAHVL